MKYILTLSLIIFSICSFSQIGGGAYRYHLKLTNPEGNVDSLTYQDSIIKIRFHLNQVENQIHILVRNTSNEIIKLVWDEVVMVQHGFTKKLMHKGVKYTDRNSSTPPSVIPPNAILDDVLVPTDNVSFSYGYYTGGWRQGSLFPDRDLNKQKNRDIIMSQIGSEISILLPFKSSSGKDYNYNFFFKIADITCVKCKTKIETPGDKGAYISIDAIGAGSENIYFTGGGSLGFGYYTKGIALGVGVGVMMFPIVDSDLYPYVPVFASLKYVGNLKKLSPYVSGEVGYSFIDAPGRMFEKEGTVKGNIYASLTGGLSLKTGKKSHRLYAYGGIMPLSFVRELGDNKLTFQELFYKFGIGVLFVKSKSD